MKATGAKLIQPNSVRIPSDVCDRIDFLMDSLRSRILDSACQRVQARHVSADANRVTEQDYLQSACEVLRQTSTELERLLKESTGHYGRVCNASRRIA